MFRKKINYFKVIFFIFIIGGFFIFPNPSFAATNDVVINELAWMGTTENWRYEWLELYNNTDQPIPLDGWKIELYRNDLDFTIELSGIIENYFLVVASDKIFSDYDFNYSNLGGKLNNGGQKIILRNGQEDIIDEINCFSSGEGWLAGDNDTKQTMEKTDSIWQTSLDIGGTPKAQNSSGSQEVPLGDDEEQPADESISDGGATAPVPVNQPPIADAGTDITALAGQKISFDGSLSSDPDNDTLTYFWNFGDGATDTEQISKHIYIYPGQYIVSLQVNDEEFSDLDIITVNIYNESIIISEFLPNPEGKDQENEWIELYNQSNQIANLTNWQLDDQDGGSSPFIFPANSLIAPNQFLVLRRPITKIALNNDNDQVRLIYPDGSLAAEVSYLAEKKQGFSVAFDGNDYFWTKIPTPGSSNIISSSGLDTETENLSKNNPEPIIQQSQDMPDVAANTNLNQSQSFDASNPLAESATCLLDSCLTEKSAEPGQIDDIIKDYNDTDFTAALNQSTQSNEKSRLILYLSIIISVSLLLSWIIIQIKKSKPLY